MAKKNDTLWSLENAEQAAKDIQFWRAEYMKRQFMQEPDYEKIKTLCNDISKKWIAYLKQYKSEYLGRYGTSFIKHLQLSHIAVRCVKKYMDEEFDFFENFSGFFLQNENVRSMDTLFETSKNYDYFIDDLFQAADMEPILLKVNEPLPPPPLFHANKHYYHRYPEHVLTLLRAPLLDLIAPPESIWNSSSKEHYQRYGVDIVGIVTSNNVDIKNICSHTRYADFIIAGQSLNEEFDIDGVCSEIRDHIVWTIYEAKRKRNLELKPAEQEAVIDLYKRMALGEYGATHKAARAIGLWLWDWRHRYQNKPATNVAAVRALKDKNLPVEHENSEDRTLLRLLENAEACIKKGEAVAVSKKSGRPSKS